MGDVPSSLPDTAASSYFSGDSHLHDDAWRRAAPACLFSLRPNLPISQSPSSRSYMAHMHTGAAAQRPGLFCSQMGSQRASMNHECPEPSTCVACVAREILTTLAPCIQYPGSHSTFFRCSGPLIRQIIAWHLCHVAQPRLDCTCQPDKPVMSPVMSSCRSSGAVVCGLITVCTHCKCVLFGVTESYDIVCAVPEY